MDSLTRPPIRDRLHRDTTLLPATLEIQSHQVLSPLDLAYRRVRAGSYWLHHLLRVIRFADVTPRRLLANDGAEAMKCGKETAKEERGV